MAYGRDLTLRGAVHTISVTSASSLDVFEATETVNVAYFFFNFNGSIRRLKVAPEVTSRRDAGLTTASESLDSLCASFIPSSHSIAMSDSQSPANLAPTSPSGVLVGMQMPEMVMYRPGQRAPEDLSGQWCV